MKKYIKPSSIIAVIGPIFLIFVIGGIIHLSPIPTPISTQNVFNKDLLKLDYEFNKVIIKTPDNQIIKGNVLKWTTYDNKDLVKVELDNGTVYLGHASDILLYNEK